MIVKCSITRLLNCLAYVISYVISSSSNLTFRDMQDETLLGKYTYMTYAIWHNIRQNDTIWDKMTQYHTISHWRTLSWFSKVIQLLPWHTLFQQIFFGYHEISCFLSCWLYDVHCFSAKSLNSYLHDDNFRRIYILQCTQNVGHCRNNCLWKH